MAKKVTGSQVEEKADAVNEEEEGAEGGEQQLDAKEALKKVIQVKVEDAGQLRRTMSITVPYESIRGELDKEYKDLVTASVIPGFRRGRAPRRLVEKRFGQDVDTQVQTRVISNAYLAAIEKEDLKVLGDPLIWAKVKAKGETDGDGQEQLMDMMAALEHIKLPEEKPLTFKCEVEVKPEFEMPNLDGVSVERPALKIEDTDVSTQIDRMRARRGNWAPIEEGGAIQLDDLLICDMVMTVDGKEVKKEDNITVAARPQSIEGVILSELGKELKGAKVGDTKTVSGDVPDDYTIEEYRGKKAKIALTINEIKRLHLPPLDKEYLESQGFEDEKEYRAWVRKQMETQLDGEIKRGMRDQVRKYLLDTVKMELPERLSSRQTERTVVRRAVDLQRRGVPLAEIQKHADELRTGAREQATQELKLHFVMEEIASKLDIEISEEDLNSQIAEIARAYNRRFDRVRDELAKNNGLESLYLDIRDERVIDKILENAKISDAPVGKAKAEKSEKKAESAKAEAPKTETKKAEKAPAASAKPKAETTTGKAKTAEAKPSPTKETKPAPKAAAKEEKEDKPKASKKAPVKKKT